MARLEQSANGVVEGGGSTMTEAALNVIENYLSLVRKYLPDSIANDIVDEIRDYIIEAAEEEGGGTLTEESAKRTVARFGAPSEVAAEYKASMLTDEDTDDIIDTKEKRTSTRAPSVPLRIERPVSTGKPVSQLTAFLQFVVAASIWAIATSIISQLFVVLMVGGAALVFTIVLAAGYVGVAIVFGFAIMIYNETNKLTPVERTYPDWPFIQRITSFPDRFLPVQSQLGIVAEVIVMAGAIVLFAFTPIWWLVIPLLLARYWVIAKRMREPDHVQYVRIDAAIEICTLLALNFVSGAIGTMMLLGYYYYVIGWAFTPIAMLIGAYILIRITAMTPELWIERITVDGKPTATAYSDAKLDREPVEDRRTGKAASYGGALFKAAIVSVFWTAVLSIALFTAANPYDVTRFVVLFACLIQMPLLVGLQILNMARIKMKGTILWNEEQKAWSTLRRTLTFPKGVFRDQSRFMLFIDMLATLGSAVAISYAFAVLLIPLFVKAFMYALVIALSVRFLFLYDRWTNGAARRHDLGEFLSTLVSLLIGNYVMMVILQGYYYLWIRYTASYYAVSGLYWPFWIVYSVYLLYSAVARGQTLWHDKNRTPSIPERKADSPKKTSPKPPEPHTPASWGKLESRYHQALRHTLGWNVVIGLVALIIYVLGTTNASQVVPLILNQILIFLLVSFIMGGFVFTTFYFLWRKGIVDSGKSSVTVGRRGRFQSFIDLGLTGFALIWIMSEVNMQSSFTRRLTSNYVQYMGQLSFVQGQIGSLIVATAFISLVFAVPLVRLISDLACLLRNDSELSNQAMLASGVLFSLLVGLTLGMIPLARNVSSSIMLPPASGEVVTLFLVLLLVILITWQTITSRIKLAELPVGARVPSGEHVVEDLGYGEIDLPIN